MQLLQIVEMVTCKLLLVKPHLWLALFEIAVFVFSFLLYLSQNEQCLMLHHLLSFNSLFVIDVVALASYAPLFVNVNSRQWNPDAIQFNSSSIAPTPSYYVQKLFMKYTGKYVIASNNSLPAGVSSVATYDNSTGNIYIPIVNFSPNTSQVSIFCIFLIFIIVAS